jgi:TorA maturation chaperone TorD
MELFRALAVLAEPPAPNVQRVADTLELGTLPDAAEHTDLFEFQLYPFASVYLGDEGMIGGDARDTVAGFWRALGQPPPDEADHLSVMLALYARLVEFEEKDAAHQTAWRSARKAFLWEHLLSWLPVYLSKVAEIASPFYRKWSEILNRALLDEARVVGMQNELPLHLREPKRLNDPRNDSAEKFLQSLLSPARAGMILVRSDLSRAASALQIGLRIGERKYVLQSMMSQDAEATLGWLAGEATSWAERHRSNFDAFGEIAKVWENRAQTGATLLNELRSAASVSVAGV